MAPRGNEWLDDTYANQVAARLKPTMARSRLRGRRLRLTTVTAAYQNVFDERDAGNGTLCWCGTAASVLSWSNGCVHRLAGSRLQDGRQWWRERWSAGPGHTTPQQRRRHGERRARVLGSVVRPRDGWARPTQRRSLAGACRAPPEETRADRRGACGYSPMSSRRTLEAAHLCWSRGVGDIAVVG